MIFGQVSDGSYLRSTLILPPERFSWLSQIRSNMSKSALLPWLPKLTTTSPALAGAWAAGLASGLANGSEPAGLVSAAAGAAGAVVAAAPRLVFGGVAAGAAGGAG